MPMNSAHLKMIRAGNARLVPVEPHVKSAETRKLFNVGVSASAQNGKSADPICYNAFVGWKTNSTGCLTLWR